MPIRLLNGQLKDKIIYLLHDIHALDDLAENNVLAVQPRGLRRADKELGAVGVGTSVGHGQNS